MTKENFTRNGIKFIWNVGGERYEGHSKYLMFYIEPAGEVMWICYAYKSTGQFTLEKAADSGAQLSIEDAIDLALKNAVKHFELELELAQLRLNDAVACLQNGP